MVTLRFTLPGSELDIVSLDATISEQHSSTADITQFPVERGADISDHVRPQPDRLRLEGVVSNSPVLDVGGTMDERQEKGERDAYSFGVRAESAYEKLKKILAAGVPVTVLTDLREYENMVMRSLEVPRSAETGDMVRFSAEFQEVTTVATQTVKLARKTSGAKKSLGKQAAKKVEEKPAAGRPDSTLRAGAKRVIGYRPPGE